jgi:arylsulfatase A-like enzyme
MKKYFMYVVKAAAFSLFFLFTTSCNNKNPERGDKNQGPPNVILILVDDMGIGDLSLYGQKTLFTPQIDQMASEGMHFSNMYTGSTVCAPSRAALLTGKHTGHTSVRGNSPQQLIGDDEWTIAKVFQKAGYTTGAIGKWGIGSYMPTNDPNRKGYDYFYGYVNMWHAHNFYPEFLYENGEKVYLNNKTMLVDGINPWADSLREGKGVAEIKNDYVHRLFDNKAIDFIEDNKEKNFFLYLAYNVPHANNEAYPDGMEVDDYYEFTVQDWPIQEKGFAAMIRNIDNSVGMILAKLKELKLDNNTLVLFCSDNGPHQEGGHKVEFFDSNSIHRGKKRDLYEGGIKTPFIARWPGSITPGSTSDETFAFWDFLPTFAELTGKEATAETDGISFLPTLLGKEQNKTHDYLYWEFYEGHGKQALIKGDWKAIKLNVRNREFDVVFELYNLRTDPSETHNVAADHPDMVAEFNALFLSAREEFPVLSLFPQ